MINDASWRTGRGEGPASSGAVLIDNSTYFSARHLLVDGYIDAYTVYNLANLLECLIVADGVLLSPTLAWSPSQEDTLFIDPAVCATLNAQEWDETALADLFVNALCASIRSVTSSHVLHQLGYTRSTVEPATRMLNSWRTKAQDSPRGFLQQYSGAVYLTDSSSKTVVESLQTATNDSMPAEYHLAQYLLRTNVAYELSKTWTYHPHSHRLRYIADRMRRANRESMDIGNGLLKYTESQLGHQIASTRRSAILRNFGGFRHEEQLPLILAAVLSQATRQDEIIPITLEIRDQRHARRYRQWARELVASIDSHDFRRQTTAEHELRIACSNLFAELHRLYAPKPSRSETVGRALTYVGTFDPKTLPDLLPDGGIKDVAAQGAITAVGMLPDLIEWLRQRRSRQNIVFLLDLARKRQRIESLNSLLQSVFHSKLNENELERLYSLRSSQRRETASIAAIVGGS